MILISHHDSSIVRNPSESALDSISSPVSIPQSVILSIEVPMILPIRDQETDSSFLESLSSRVAVVGLVSDYPLGSGSWSSWSAFWDSDLSNNLIKERDLSRRGRVGMASERNTLAIDQYHTLCSLAPLGLPDSRALFLPERSSHPQTLCPNPGCLPGPTPRGRPATCP